MAGKRDLVAQDWLKFFKNCLKYALNAKSFRAESQKRISRNPTDGKAVLLAWVQTHDGSFSVLPRLKEYLVQLLELDVISDAHALISLSTSIKVTFASQQKYLVVAGAACGEWKQCIEAAILECLSTRVIHLRDNLIRSRSSKVAEGERTRCVRIYKAMIGLLPAYTTLARGLENITGPAFKIGEELGKYVLAYVNYLSVVEKLTTNGDDVPDYCKEGFGRTLPPFISILTTTSNELAESLALLQRQAGFFEKESSDNLDDGLLNDLNALNSLTYQQNVLDLPPVVTRAGLYIYLNAMLTGRPLCDDAALFTFLNTRYHGTVDSLIADLITASFDVLANAINRTEQTDSINVYRSFLINKLPVLLESFSGMIYPPLTVESCITDALNRMDPSADPFSTQSFDLLSSSGMLSEARQEFLFACALYSLIPESSIESILGDVPMQSLPESGKYSRTGLVAMCTANPAKIEELIAELENMEGNSAEIAAALVEIIHTLCMGKDSVTLKGICNALSRKTQAMNVLLLFTEPRTILQPLCDMLDHWQDAEDQNEYHPVYDEFGSIFLLVLVFRQHFNLQLSDLGINYPESFVKEYIQIGCTPHPISDLSEAEIQRLGGWVKGLYESEGISDELMSTCSPKAFHLLIATLFDQSLKANQSGLLAFDAIKGGFEYLLEPFLIPSLVAGLGWATRRLWETQAQAPHLDFLLPILSLLVRPASLSSDSTNLHESVLSITSKPLERSLAHVQKLHPRRQDIDPLLNALKSRVQPSRAATTSHTELETWCATPGGFPAALRHTLHNLVAWSATGSLQSAPPHYSHRQLLMATQMLGASTALASLFDEATKLVAAGSAANIVLDVLSALICAPFAAHGRSLLSLRDALRVANDDAYALSKTDPGRAALVVGLQRKVQAQSLRPVEEAVAAVADAADVAEGLMMTMANGDADNNNNNIGTGIGAGLDASGGGGGLGENGTGTGHVDLDVEMDMLNGVEDSLAAAAVEDFMGSTGVDDGTLFGL